MSLIINNNLMAANAARNLNNHYSGLATSVKRLSSGLRVVSSSDDAAGLAIRELMRAEIASLNQGVRNANDAISMIQTADGALAIIDEKLVRMKELAEQAATGTYNSDQRLMIHSEFTAMAAEIERIANATDFNGIKLLDGSLSGVHDGSGLESTGECKIHFGPSNNAAEDYYYLGIPPSTLSGLGFSIEGFGEPLTGPSSLLSMAASGSTSYSVANVKSGIIAMSYIPAGTKNITITIDGYPGAEDDIQLFTRNGEHISGTKITSGPDNDYTWQNARPPITGSNVDTVFVTEANGFNPGASYSIPPSFNDGMTGGAFDLNGGVTTSYGGMNIRYSGDYDRYETGADENNGMISHHTKEQIFIDEVTEDILIFVSGQGIFGLDADWESPPAKTALDISTQSKAQTMILSVDNAIVMKDKIRAHLGATQNRLENTMSNLQIEAENMQASESRISDVDVATEMTEFVRQQILTQSATAMLSQANSLPQMAMQIIQK